MKRATRAVSAGLLLMAVACQSDHEKNDLTPVPGTEVENFVQEEAYPGRVGAFESVIVEGEALSVMNVEDEYVLEGDILIPRDVAHPNSRTEAVGVVGQRWPKGVIYYSIASNVPPVNRARIRDAINYWTKKTKLRFEWRTNQRNYVMFQRSDGCSANVGMIGGKQVINLSTECSLGNTIHEIGHCVGLFHEHTRLNRDKYIRINFSNVQEGAEENFVRADIRTHDVQDWAGQINFGSIMMYSATAFSKNGRPTIVRKDGKGYAAQRDGLSSVDVMGVNRMYP